MRRSISLLLFLALFCGLLSGCRTDGKAIAESPVAQTSASTPTAAAPSDTRTPTTEAPASTAAPTEVPTEPSTEAPTDAPTESPTEPLPDESELPLADYSITWKAAFRNDKMPEGEVSGDQVAFYVRADDGTVTIRNVPKAEILANQPERLPRTHYFEQYLPQSLLQLLPILDYAYANGFSRIALPTVYYDLKEIEPNQRYLNATYRNNNSIMGFRKVDSVEVEPGVTLRYFLITIGSLERGAEIFKHYREAIAAAEALVDSIPADYDEEQSALYLYHWLTENVVYDHDDYYSSDGVNLLYDAMIKHKTVCAGYTEAFYYLCNLAGIECFTAGGNVVDANGEYQSHIWNVARIDGTWYQFDSTWDEGLQVAEYNFFGVSVQTMMDYYKREYNPFSSKHLPELTEDLMPTTDVSYAETPDGSMIYWFFRILNARNGNPQRILTYFGMEKEMQEAEDGWLRSSEDPDLFRTALEFVMFEDVSRRFCDGYVREADGVLYLRKPEPDPIGYRLLSAKLQTDGTWRADVLVCEDFTFTPRTVTITMTDGRISSVEGLD